MVRVTICTQALRLLCCVSPPLCFRVPLKLRARARVCVYCACVLVRAAWCEGSKYPVADVPTIADIAAVRARRVKRFEYLPSRRAM